MSCCMRLGPYYNKRNSGVCGIIKKLDIEFVTRRMVVVHPLFTGFGHYYILHAHS